MRLLIIEDNLALAWRLQASLESDFEVHVARTGASGQRQAETDRFDLIILDLGLPDMSGAEVCNNVRAASIVTPILILTGEDTVQTKVHLFGVGADDYLTKPFELEELRARITALLRRRQVGAPPKLLEVGDLRIDPRQRTVEYAGSPVLLRRKEFDILEYLARNQGKVVTQAMIFNHVWGDLDKDVWNNTVRVHVKHLRDKIDRPFNTSMLKTARGVGYVLEAP